LARPLCRPGADKVAFDVDGAAKQGNHQAAGALVLVSAHGSAIDLDCPPGVERRRSSEPGGLFASPSPLRRARDLQHA
jgi:hypothetical protein